MGFPLLFDTMKVYRQEELSVLLTGRTNAIFHGISCFNSRHQRKELMFGIRVRFLIGIIVGELIMR